MKALLLWMIRFYQRNISPLRPPCCRFIPTCSAYALEAVEKSHLDQQAFKEKILEALREEDHG